MQGTETTIREPIVVVCDVVEVFETVSDAVSYIEAPHIAEGVYECPAAYDSDGRLLKLVVISTRQEPELDPQAKPKTWLRRIFSPSSEEGPYGYLTLKIESMEAEPTHQTELREVLTKLFRSMAEYESTPISEAWLAQATLRELMDMGMQWKVR